MSYFFLAPRGETSRAPVQSLPAFSVEVCCRPAVGADSLIPLGPAAQHVLVGEDAITQGAHALLAR